MARPKIKSATDQRPFIMVYHDFLDSDVIGSHEKMVFIALKKFADSKNQCFPSLKKLSDVTGLSKRKIQDTLKELEQKHIITIESRLRADGGTTSNLYTLYDFKELWNAGSSEEMAAVVDEYEDKKLISLLEAKGYTVIKEKEPYTTEPTKDQLNQALMNNSSLNLYNYITDDAKSQELERYTIDQIRQIFDYDILVNDKPLWQKDIDSVFSILHTALNTTKETIRVGGEDKPTMIVIGKLMKLDYSEIMYCIEKYNEQTERIKNPTAYMLTLLYNAKEQMNLDISNQVQHDMYNWKSQTE